MTNSEDNPPPAVGAYWIKEEDYPAFAATFQRWRPRCHRTGKEWLKMGPREMEQGLKAYGHVVLRVLHRPGHISGLVRRPMAQARTAPDAEKVRRGGGNREIWPTGLTSTVLTGRRPLASPDAHGETRGEAFPSLDAALRSPCVHQKGRRLHDPWVAS